MGCCVPLSSTLHRPTPRGVVLLDASSLLSAHLPVGKEEELAVGEEKECVQEHSVRHGVRDIAMFFVPPPRGPALTPIVSVRAV